MTGANELLPTPTEISVSFNASGIKEVLGIYSPNKAIDALAESAIAACQNTGCGLRAICNEPLTLLPGPSKVTGLPGYVPEDYDDKHAVVVSCSADECPNPEATQRLAEVITRLERDCKTKTDEALAPTEEIIDEAEEARDAILAKAQEEADNAYYARYRKIHDMKATLYADIRARFPSIKPVDD